MSDINLSSRIVGAQFSENKHQRLMIYSQEEKEDHSGVVVDYVSVGGKNITKLDRVIGLYSELKNLYRQNQTSSKFVGFDFSLLAAATRRNVNVNLEGLSFDVHGAAFSKDFRAPKKIEGHIRGTVELEASGPGDMDVSVIGFMRDAANKLSNGAVKFNVFYNVDATVHGGDGNDKILGISDAKIYGGNGNDTLTSGDRSVIDGGNGDDKIYGGGGSTITGGSGNDRITALRYATVSGGDGNDWIDAGDGTTAHGDDGDDILAGHNAILFGGAGNDILGGEGGRGAQGGGNRLIGGEGDDEVHLAVASTAVFNLGDGYDTVFFREFGGTIELGAGIKKNETRLSQINRTEFFLEIGNGGDKMKLSMEGYDGAEADHWDMFDLRHYGGLNIKFSNGEKINIVSEGGFGNVIKLTSVDLKV